MRFWWETRTKPVTVYREQGAWARGCASAFGYSAGGVLILSAAYRGGILGFLLASVVCLVVQALWRLLLRYTGDIRPASELVDDSVRQDAAAYRVWLRERESERARSELESQAAKQQRELELQAEQERRRAERAVAAAAEAKAAKDLADALEWRKIQAESAAPPKPKPRPMTPEEERAAQERRDRKLLEEWRAKRARGEEG
jgi:hypothetical protein